MQDAVRAGEKEREREREREAGERRRKEAGAPATTWLVGNQG